MRSPGLKWGGFLKMRLINCKINDFGKLHDFEWQFDSGLSSIVAENGWGKSTLTVFIVVMFYGFANEHKRSLVDNERKHYQPWQQGTYGGKLTFRTAGKKYLLERTFGARPKEDYFALYDAVTNLPSNDFTTKIGEEIFGIDRTSFENTLFIAQQNCQTDVTPGINAKIGNLSGEQADMNSYQLVQGKFKEQTNHLTSRRKTGELYQVQAKIAEIKVDLERQPVILKQVAEKKEKLSLLNEKRQQLKQQQVKLQERLQQSSQNQDQQLASKKYQLLLQQKQQILTKINLIKQQFSGQVPSLITIEKQQKKAEQINLLANMIKTPGSTDNERLEQLLQRRIDQVTVDQLTKMTAKNQQLRKLKLQEQQSGLSTAEMMRLSVAQTKFAQRPITETKIAELETWLLERHKLQDQFEKKQAEYRGWQQATTGSLRRQTRPKILNSKIWLFISILMIGLGIVNFQTNLFMGMILFLIGCLLLIWKILQQPVQPKQANLQILQLEKELQDLQQQVAKVTNRIEQRLQQFEINCPVNAASNELAKFKNEYLDFQQLSQRKARGISAADLQQMQQLQTELLNFINYYQVDLTADYATALQQLKFEIQEYHHLQQQQSQTITARKKYQVLMKEQQDFLTSFKQSETANFSDQLQILRDQVITLQHEEQQLANLKVMIQNFLTENPTFYAQNSTTSITNQPDSLSELTNELNTVKEKLEKNQQKAWKITTVLSEFEKEINYFNQLSSQKTEFEQKNLELTKRFKLLTATSKYLATAKNNFSARYMDPIMKNFAHYYQELAQENSQNYRLDAELNLTAAAYGKQHQLNLLSEGYQDLLGICRRLSLIDAMYQQEKPPIIFDDPFVNLDAEKLQGGMKLLQELAKEHQIIYLTCHPSRTLK